MPMYIASFLWMNDFIFSNEAKHICKKDGYKASFIHIENMIFIFYLGIGTLQLLKSRITKLGFS